jgi:hypothetical protein
LHDFGKNDAIDHIFATIVELGGYWVLRLVTCLIRFSLLPYLLFYQYKLQGNTANLFVSVRANWHLTTSQLLG